MRKLPFLFATFALCFIGCDRSSEYNPETDPELTRNAEVYQTFTYTPEEFGEFVGHSFDDYCNYLSETLPTSSFVQYSLNSFVKSHREILEKDIASESGLTVSEVYDKWTIKRYNFTYETTSTSREPITLSATLLVPEVNIDGVQHKLRAMSLCPPHMPIEEKVCPSADGTILMARALYNHAVVVPDYQGRGVTSNMTYSNMHTQDHAVESIDAALAAKSLLKKMGYEFEDGAGIYNVGVSEGGEVAYAIHYLIENGISSTKKDILNLKLSFSANGALFHNAYVDDKISRVEYTGDQAKYEEEMRIFRNAFECFTEEEKQGYNSSIFYSTEILSSDGTSLNPDHPVFEVLKKGLERNDINYNWEPKCPLTLAGSNDDTTIKLSLHGYKAFEMLRNKNSGIPNYNVLLDAFSTPASSAASQLIGERYMIAHIMADMICFVHAIEYEDPASADIVNYLL